MARFYTALATDGSPPSREIVRRKPERTKILTLTPEQLDRFARAGRRRDDARYGAGARIKGVQHRRQDRHGADRTSTRTVTSSTTRGSSGFAPADDPKIVVAVMLEFGDHGIRRGARSRRRSSSTISRSRRSQTVARWRADGRASRSRRLSAGRPRAAAVGLRHRHRVLRRPDRHPDRAVVGAWKRQLVWFGVALGRRVLRRAARSVRLIEWLTVPAYCPGHRLLVVTLLFGWPGAGTAASMKGWLDDRRRPHRPAVGAREDHRGARCSRACSRRARNRRSRCSSSGSRRSSSGVPWLLIMAQPDLGTGIVFVGIFFAMLFWSGVSWPLLVLIASPVGQPDPRLQHGALGRVVPPAHRARAVVQAIPGRGRGARASRTSRWACSRRCSGSELAPYQQRRLLVFLDPQRDPRASGYHVIQSQIAIGSGGWFGKGLHARHAEAARVPPGAAHRLHLRRRRRGARASSACTLALTLFLLLFLRVIARRRARQRLVQQPRRLRPAGELVRARARERRA